MSDLTPDDEALIHAARGGLEATPEDQARIKRKLFVQIGIAAGVGGSAISTSTAASAGAAGAGAAATTTAVAVTSLTTKLFLAAIVIGTASGGFAIVRSSHAPAATVPTITTSAPASAQPIENAAPVVTSLATPAPSTLSVEPAPKNDAVPAPKTASIDRAPPTSIHATPSTATPPPVSPPTIATSTSATSSAAPPVTMTGAVTPTPSGPTTVDAEAALLRNADAELKKGDANGALALVDQHAAQFPNGILSEERDAERVVVLCALGRTEEARAAAAAFLRARPKSPLASRVRASCGGN